MLFGLRDTDAGDTPKATLSSRARAVDHAWSAVVLALPKRSRQRRQARIARARWAVGWDVTQCRGVAAAEITDIDTAIAVWAAVATAGHGRMQITVGLLIVSLQRYERVGVQSTQDRVGNRELVEVISEKVARRAVNITHPQRLIAWRVGWLPAQKGTHHILPDRLVHA